MSKKITLPQKLIELRLNFQKEDGSVGLSLREAANLLSKNGYPIQHAGYAKWEKTGANLPKRAAIEAICRSFQIETEELLAEFRSETKKRVSAQRFEMLASKIALLKDEEFDHVISLVDSFLSKSHLEPTLAEKGRG
jgi:hypothetical protein